MRILRHGAALRSPFVDTDASRQMLSIDRCDSRKIKKEERKRVAVREKRTHNASNLVLAHGMKFFFLNKILKKFRSDQYLYFSCHYYYFKKVMHTFKKKKKKVKDFELRMASEHIATIIDRQSVRELQSHPKMAAADCHVLAAYYHTIQRCQKSCAFPSPAAGDERCPTSLYLLLSSLFLSHSDPPCLTRHTLPRESTPFCIAHTRAHTFRFTCSSFALLRYQHWRPKR